MNVMLTSVGRKAYMVKFVVCVLNQGSCRYIYKKVKNNTLEI